MSPENHGVFPAPERGDLSNNTDIFPLVDPEGQSPIVLVFPTTVASH
jgi:hypothetical protein